VPLVCAVSVSFAKLIMEMVGNLTIESDVLIG